MLFAGNRGQDQCRPPLATVHEFRANSVPDQIILEMIGTPTGRTGLAEGCLFDGFPRTIAQAEALDEFLSRRGQPLSGVLELQVDQRN